MKLLLPSKVLKGIGVTNSNVLQEVAMNLLASTRFFLQKKVN